MCSEVIQLHRAVPFDSSLRVGSHRPVLGHSPLASRSGLWELGGCRAGWEGGCLPAQTLMSSSLSNLGVPPGRGNCPLTVPLPFDLIYTDYHGLQQMKQHMGLSFKKYR